ncbi:hypothetical protein FACS189487_06970 [Campylobacterota bacterium]|nr:hypothetical protein FACS189487_06970 [Campylobacterota bacterium]
MASPYEMDKMGSEARSLRGYIAARIPEKDWDTNEDRKKTTFFNQVLLRSGFDDYIDYIAVMTELDKIYNKYKGMPDLHYEKFLAKSRRLREEEEKRTNLMTA